MKSKLHLGEELVNSRARMKEVTDFGRPSPLRVNISLLMRSLTALLLTSFSLIICAPLVAQDDSLEWLNNYKDAIEESKRTNKPIFLEFRCEP